MNLVGVFAWLEKNPSYNAIIALAYYLSVVLPHKRFGTFLNTVVFQGITRAEYNRNVLILSFIGLSIYIGLFINGIKNRDDKKKLTFYLITNIFLAIATIKYLFVINIEVIHFPQYAVFAILIFPFCYNYNQTLLLGVIAGAIDEAHQYFVLTPRDTNYYDFNDVVTNLIGVVFGLLLIRSLGIVNKKKFTFWRSPAFISLISLSILLTTLWFSGLLSIYPDESAKFQLIQKLAPGFWSKVYPEVIYHVIQPVEGLLITSFLLFFFSKIGKD